jgi:hypothetical protein
VPSDNDIDAELAALEAEVMGDLASPLASQSIDEATSGLEVPMRQDIAYTPAEYDLVKSGDSEPSVSPDAHNGSTDNSNTSNDNAVNDVADNVNHQNWEHSAAAVVTSSSGRKQPAIPTSASKASESHRDTAEPAQKLKDQAEQQAREISVAQTRRQEQMQDSELRARQSVDVRIAQARARRAKFEKGNMQRRKAALSSKEQALADRLADLSIKASERLRLEAEQRSLRQTDAEERRQRVRCLECSRL